MKKLNIGLSAAIINAITNDMFSKDIIIQRPRAQGKTEVLKGIFKHLKEWNKHQIENAKKKRLNKKDIETAIKMVNSSKPNLYDSYNGSTLPPMPVVWYKDKPWYDEVPPVDLDIWKKIQEKIKPSIDVSKIRFPIIFGTAGEDNAGDYRNIWDKSFEANTPILKGRYGQWLNPVSNKALDEIAFFKKHLFKSKYEPYTFEQRILIYGFQIS